MKIRALWLRAGKARLVDDPESQGKMRQLHEGKKKTPGSPIKSGMTEEEGRG